MLSSPVYRRLRAIQEFAEPAVMLSRSEMIDLIKTTKNRSMRVWSTKMEGGGLRRVMQTRDLVTPAPQYVEMVRKRRRTNQQRNEWVMYSETDRGWRTIMLDEVEKVKIGNQVYKVR